MVGKIFLILLSGLILSNCSNNLSDSFTNSPNNLSEGEVEANEEKNIHSLVIERWLIDSIYFEGDTIYIEKETGKISSDWFNIQLNKSRFSETDAEMIDDFNSQNLTTSEIKTNLNISQKYKFISESENVNETELKKADHNLSLAFQKKFPDAKIFIAFSKIGFNNEKSKAIVYSHNLFDKGGYFLLQKENCQWKLVEYRNAWVH